MLFLPVLFLGELKGHMGFLLFPRFLFLSWRVCRACKVYDVLWACTGFSCLCF